MLNYSKRNPAIFFGRVGEIYIVGWVLTGYLFDCPQNSRLFLLCGLSVCTPDLHRHQRRVGSAVKRTFTPDFYT
jgi:hypothetical protein